MFGECLECTLYHGECVVVPDVYMGTHMHIKRSHIVKMGFDCVFYEFEYASCSFTRFLRRSAIVVELAVANSCVVCGEVVTVS